MVVHRKSGKKRRDHEIGADLEARKRDWGRKKRDVSKPGAHSRDVGFLFYGHQGIRKKKGIAINRLLTSAT